MGKAMNPDVPADKLALYDRLLATNPNVERKGEGMPYTSLNGHMFSFLTPSGELALRLPEPARREFLARYQTTLCEQHGVPMAEYVNVPETLFENIEEMSKHFDVAYMYVAMLKPKPTTRTMKPPAKQGARTGKPARAAKKPARKAAQKAAAKSAKATKKPPARKATQKAAAKAAKKPPARKTTRKAASKAAKKPARQAAKKTARQPAKKPARQAVEKAARKPASKTNHTPTRAPRQGAARKGKAGARKSRRRQAL